MAIYAFLKAEEIVEPEEQETLSDGIAGSLEPGTIALPVCQQVIDEYVMEGQTCCDCNLRAKHYSGKIREGFIAFLANRVQMPSVQQFLFKDVQDDSCIKSAWVEGTDTFCVKISNDFHLNGK